MPNHDVKAQPQSVSIAAVGDIMLDTRLRAPRLFYYQTDFATCIPTAPQRFRFPFVNTAGSREWLSGKSDAAYGIDSSAHASQSIPLDLPNEANPGFAFEAIHTELRRSDLVFGNLECPLSDRGRRLLNDQCYSAPPRLGAGLAEAPFRVVSFANNHCMDYGEVAFHDTLDVLGRHGIAVVGAGRSLEEARTPALFNLDGVRIAFLAYTLIGPDWIYACEDECGAAPLNPYLVEQDISRARATVDLIIVSAHWGSELMGRPWRGLTDLAHRVIDAGADAVLGHHSHTLGSVELYRGRPILYSLGNFCFGHDHVTWGNNVIARLEIVDRQFTRIEFTPIGGKQQARYQPVVLNGPAAREVFAQVRWLSEPFGTELRGEPDGRFSVSIPSHTR